jgi:hypothetical protein
MLMCVSMPYYRRTARGRERTDFGLLRGCIACGPRTRNAVHRFDWARHWLRGSLRSFSALRYIADFVIFSPHPYNMRCHKTPPAASARPGYCLPRHLPRVLLQTAQRPPAAHHHQPAVGSRSQPAVVVCFHPRRAFADCNSRHRDTRFNRNTGYTGADERACQLSGGRIAGGDTVRARGERSSISALDRSRRGIDRASDWWRPRREQSKFTEGVCGLEEARRGAGVNSTSRRSRPQTTNSHIDMTRGLFKSGARAWAYTSPRASGPRQ